MRAPQCHQQPETHMEDKNLGIFGKIGKIAQSGWKIRDSKETEKKVLQF